MTKWTCLNSRIFCIVITQDLIFFIKNYKK